MVIIYGMRDKVIQGMMFLVNMFTGIRHVFAGIPTRSIAILYIMHSIASILRSDRDLHPNVWCMLIGYT